MQLLTVPCYFLGAGAYMATAWLSDRLQMRGVFCVVFGTLSAVGYAVLLSDSPTAVHYFACFLVAGGLYVVVGLPLAWVRRRLLLLLLLLESLSPRLLGHARDGLGGHRGGTRCLTSSID